MASTDAADERVPIANSGSRSQSSLLGSPAPLSTRALPGSWASLSLLLLAVALLPLLGANTFDLGRYGVAICYIMVAVGLNLAFGYAGQFALGNSVIMAVAAYAAAMLSARTGLTAGLAAPIGVFVGVMFGTLMMLPGLRVRGWYLALITMFSVLVLPKVVNYFEAWTGGEFGLTGIQEFALLGYRFSGPMLFELTVICFGLIWFGATNFVNSAWGLRIRALRDSERAGESVGIDLRSTRLVTYIVSSIPAAVSGVLLAYTEQFVNPDSFGMGLALLLLTGMVLGGMGTTWGPVVGMIPLVALSFWVGPFSQYNPLFLGVGLLICAVAFPDGFVSELKKLARLRNKSTRTNNTEVEEHVRISDELVRPFRSTYVPRVSESKVVVEASGVVTSFGGVRALDGVEFSLSPSRLCGLVGPNGSGKSTLLNAISGFIPPNTGTIRIAGTAIDQLPPHKIASVGVGRTFQVPLLIEDLSVIENIEVGLVGAEEECSVLGAILHSPSVRRAAAERRRKAEAAFLAVGLDRDLADLPVSELPLGLKRIVEVGRAIAAGPTLLLLDEPAAGLNNEERQMLGRLLIRLKEMGMTVLVVEHNVPFVMEFCDEIALLMSGQVRCHTNMSGTLPPELSDYLNYGLESGPVLSKAEA